MITTIKASKSFDYDEKYDIDIRTSKELTSKEYEAILGAIDTIRLTLNGHIQKLLDNKKKESQ